MAVGFKIAANSILRGRYATFAGKFTQDAGKALAQTMLAAHMLALKEVLHRRRRDGNLVLDLEPMRDIAQRLSIYFPGSEDQLVDLYNQYQRHAFDVVDDLAESTELQLRQEVADLISSGATARDAQDAIREKLDSLGVGDAEDYRLETLFRTQSQMAYGAGKWLADQDPDIQDILWGYEYSAVMDDRTRESHRILDGVKLPKDDPFWQRFWPPNGYNCRCTVIPVTVEDAEIVEPPDGIEPDPGFGFNAGSLIGGVLGLSLEVMRVDMLEAWSLAKEPDGRWVTINGAAVFIGKDGTIEKGPSYLKGKKKSEVVKSSKKEAKTYDLPDDIKPAKKSKKTRSIKAIEKDLKGQEKLDPTPGPSELHISPPKGVTSKKWAQALPTQQRDAIELWSTTMYSQIREAESGAKLERSTYTLADDFNAGLDKAPKYVGDVYRGMNIPQNSKAYGQFTNVGATIQFKASSSATRSPFKALGFNGRTMMLRVRSKTGAAIESASNLGGELEVVMRKGSTYRITAVHKNLTVKFHGVGTSGYRGEINTLVDLEEI